MWNEITVTVACHRCGKPQLRHYSRANQQATCFACRAERQKEWSKGRSARKASQRANAVARQLSGDDAGVTDSV